MILHDSGCEDLDYFAVRVRKKSLKGDRQKREFDVIAACHGIFILNETKSSPEIRDVDKLAAFVESNELFDYFPEYEGCRVCPVFSSLYMDDSLVAYLTRKGIYALTHPQRRYHGYSQLGSVGGAGGLEGIPW